MYFFLSTAMYVLVPQYSNVQYVLAPQNSNVRHILCPQQNNGCTCSLVQQCMYSFLCTVLYSMYFFLSMYNNVCTCCSSVRMYSFLSTK
jgi:hypothetical protein